MYKCIDYEEKDCPKILSLFKEVFNQDINEDFWKWRFVKNPFGKGIIKLLFDKDKLIGHYALNPMELCVNDKKIPAVFSLNTMTHPDYRGKGIFPFLAKKAYEQSEQRGYKLVYGFPNNLSYATFIKKLDWIGLDKMSILYKELDSRYITTIRPMTDIYKIQKIMKFDYNINLFWEKIKGDYNIIIPRTKEFLNWRFVQNPKVDYTIYIIKNNNNEILGYIILKIRFTEKGAEGHIIDILSVNKDKIAKDLIMCALDYFIEKDVNVVTCWMQDNYFYANILKKEKFIRKYISNSPYFGVKIFNKEDKGLKTIKYAKSWYLTMGDCDVF